jgi:hypothetical protein
MPEQWPTGEQQAGHADILAEAWTSAYVNVQSPSSASISRCLPAVAFAVNPAPITTATRKIQNHVSGLTALGSRVTLEPVA